MGNSPIALRTEVVRFQSGERLPLLVEAVSGLPLLYPTYWLISERRSVGCAVNTLNHDIANIKHLYSWAATMDIDLEGRFASGNFLSLGEINSFATAASLWLEDLVDSGPHSQAVNGNVISISRAFRIPRKPLRRVDPNTEGQRLFIARSYLDWLALAYTSGLPRNSAEYAAVTQARLDMRDRLEARMPQQHGRNQENRRVGLSEEQMDIVFNLIDPRSPDNPWRDPFARKRNQVMLHTQNGLGLRRGETIKIRVDEVDLQGRTIFISRTPDDPEDPRRDAPQTKTRDRVVPIDDLLARMLFHHIIDDRSKVTGARRHPYLFVTSEKYGGRPVSASVLSDIYKTIRVKCPSLPKGFTSHVARHTWNDRLSELMDREGVDEAEEHRLRAYLMGWSPTSRSVETYTRRHVRRKGNEASLRLQKKMFNRIQGDPGDTA